MIQIIVVNLVRVKAEVSCPKVSGLLNKVKVKGIKSNVPECPVNSYKSNEDPKKKEDGLSVRGPIPPTIVRNNAASVVKEVVLNPDLPKVVRKAVAKPSSFEPVVVPLSSASNGIQELPANGNRIKLVHSNGYSLNYIPQTLIPGKEKSQTEVLQSLHNELVTLVSVKNSFDTSTTDFEITSSDKVNLADDADNLFPLDSYCVDEPLRFVGIDSNFRLNYPDRQSLSLAPVNELPSIPVCPDTYLRQSMVMDRPKISQCFLDLFPKEALIYCTVRSFQKPNYLGAKIPVSKFPIDKWSCKREIIKISSSLIFCNLAGQWALKGLMCQL